jgi:hypothetical protein
MPAAAKGPISSWASIIFSLAFAVAALGGCAAHGQLAANPRPVYPRNTLHAPRVAAQKPKQITGTTTDPSGLSDARKEELFRQFDEWQTRENDLQPTGLATRSP